MTSYPQPQPIETAARDRYIPALDGLRGAAILLVLVRHMLPTRQLEHPDAWYVNSLIEVSWSGVDLFFVLSGYLITGILLKTRHAPRYYANFYARRSLRIFPLYYVTLLFLFVILPYLAPWFAPGEIPPGDVWPWYALYGVNLLRVFWSGVNPPVNHFWSLAIEEHFYLAWPAVVRKPSLRTLTYICIGCVVFAGLMRASLALNDVNKYIIHQFTLCRLDALALGALLAVARLSERWQAVVVYWRRAVFFVGGALFLILVLPDNGVPERPVSQIFCYPLIACSYAALISMAADPVTRSPLTRAFEWPPLRFLGKYSYAIYVFHPLVDAGLESLLPQDSVLMTKTAPWRFLNFLVKIVLTIILAMITWQAIEKPFLRLKRYFETKE